MDRTVCCMVHVSARHRVADRCCLLLVNNQQQCNPLKYSIWPRRVVQREGKRSQLDYLSSLSLPQSLVHCCPQYLIGCPSTLIGIVRHSNHGTEHDLSTARPLYGPTRTDAVPASKRRRWRSAMLGRRPRGTGLHKEGSKVDQR